MRFIDFFAGIGGFRLGMEMAGHKCVGHCEIDKYADASYRMMHTVTERQREDILELPFKQRIEEVRKEIYTNGEWYADDITRVRADDLPEAEVYCFGFPCQSFSIAGKRGGFEDTRGTLFFEVMRLAEVRRPSYLFAENVRGLLNHDGGATFETIIRTMVELGYGVEWQVCNSKHFGVPQNRERVFIVGHLGGLSGREIFPLGTHDPETDELQRYTVSNTITTRAGAETIGTYVADRQTDRQTDHKGQWNPQGIRMSTDKPPKRTDICNALIARYNTEGKYERTYVIDEDD